MVRPRRWTERDWIDWYNGRVATLMATGKTIQADAEAQAEDEMTEKYWAEQGVPRAEAQRAVSHMLKVHCVA